MRVRDLEDKVAEQQETNEALRARNNALAAEVRDLQSGSSAVEERARMEQGMLREDEIFVQVLTNPAAIQEADEAQQESETAQ